MKPQFYNHKGKILFGNSWPEIPEVKASAYADQAAVNSFNRQMENLLQERYQVKVTNPGCLPPITENHFIDANNYKYELKGNTCTIIFPI